MFKPLEILKAWRKVLKGVTTEEDKRRALICSSCPSRKHGKILEFINDELQEVNGFYCGECKCPLVAKIRSNDKCNKWETPTN